MSELSVLGPSGIDRSRNVLFLFPDWDDATWTASLSAVAGTQTANLVTRQPTQVAGYDVSAASVTLNGAMSAAQALGGVCIPYANASTAATWRIRAGATGGEASGAHVADVSGHARHGTPSGGLSFSAGKLGGALALDGTAALATPTLTIANALTLCGWLRVDELGAIRYLIDHSSGAYASLQADGTLIVNDDPGAVTSSSWVPGVWSHFAIVLNAGTSSVKLYVDGDLEVDGALVGQTISGIGTFALGNLIFPGSDTGILGALDDVRIYDRELSQAEVQAAMQAEATAPFDASLQVYYPCNGYDSGTLTFGAPPNLATYTRRLGFHCLAYDIDAAVLRVTLTDPGNTSLRLGRLVAGSVYQPDSNFDFGFQLGHKDDTKKSRTPTGQTTTKSSVPVPFVDFTIRHVSREAIMLHFYEMQRQYGTSRPFVVCCDPGDDQYLQMLTLYGLADDLNAFPWQWANGWDASWRFEAML